MWLCYGLVLLLQAAPAVHSSRLHALAAQAICQARCYANTEFSEDRVSLVGGMNIAARLRGDVCDDGDNECQQCVRAVKNAADRPTSCDHYSCDFEPCISSCSCLKEVQNMSDPLRRSRVDGEVGIPVLHCRSSSDLGAMVYVRWSGPRLPLVYVIEVKIHTSSPWIPFFTNAGRWVLLSQLRPQKLHKVRVRGMAGDGQVGNVAESDWFNTLPANHNPEPVSNVTVVIKNFTESDLNARIVWTPGPDLPCFYQIALFPSKGISYIFREIVAQFEVSVNIEFDNTYNMTVRAQDAVRRSESDMSWTQFVTPTCLQAHNYNLSICSPEIPVVNVTEEKLNESQDGMMLYDVMVSWEKPTVEPYVYVTSLFVKKPREFYHTVNTTGNSTSVRMCSVPLGERHRLLVRACSPAGCSEPYATSRENKRVDFQRGGDTAGEDETGEEKTALETTGIGLVAWVTVGVSVGTVTVMLGVVVTMLRARAKSHLISVSNAQQEALQLVKETKEPGDSLDQDFVDEWDIPQSRLVVGEKVGEGEFGVVHRGLLRRGKNTPDYYQVAVKSLKRNASKDDVASFLGEIEVMKLVGRHPNIVSLIACCTRSAELQLVIEYCNNGDLQKYLYSEWEQLLLASEQKDQSCASPSTNNNDNPVLHSNSTSVPPRSAEDTCVLNAVDNMVYMAEVEMLDSTIRKEQLQSELVPDSRIATKLLSFARQVAIGMEFLSSFRIVHRDIAARNVLVCGDTTVKISDFGLSRDIYLHNVYRRKGNGCLPFKWMALESVLHQVYTTQSDVWSFGVLLWEIATLGGTPYAAMRSQSILTMLKAGQRLECPTSCSSELYQIMIDCWNVKAWERPTFTELRQRLDSLLEASASHQYLKLEMLGNEYSCSASSSGSSSPDLGSKTT